VLPCNKPTERDNTQLQFTSTLNSVAKVMGGNIASNLISLVTSILIARWVDPHDMGIWNAASLVTIYTSTLQLGVFNGLSREFPYLIGAGDRKRALRMAEAASAWSWLLVGGSILCGALIALWFWMKGQPERCIISIAVAVLVVCSWPTYYLTTTYRTRHEFGRLAKNTVAVALIGAALVLLVWRFHFIGLILRASLISILGLLALFYRRPLRVKPQWGIDQLVQLAKVGIPIWLVGQLLLFFISMDRLILVKSIQVLGYFTIAIQVSTFARQIPMAFSMVLYPQMAHQYGENHCAMDIWRIARKGALFVLPLGIIVGVCGWLLLPRFVLLLLPKYIPGIRAAQLSSFICFAMAFDMFDAVFNVIKRQDLYVINWCVSCSTFVAVWYFLTLFFHVSLAVASAESMLCATLIMGMNSVLLSRRACLVHDQSMHAGK